ncbi:MAG: hypothetical protein GXP42_10285 [Chloroflexi bacterium]|nr:hypothetical protein [Chloroflexota bacterium]
MTQTFCPYLRGRYGPQPDETPGEGNHCILAASIHLPRSQQTRFCLTGRFEQCSRYRRQADRPLPAYITGVRVEPLPPPRQRPDLPDLPWRRPLARRLARLVPILVLLALLVLGWRYRQSATPARIYTRPPLPTPIQAPSPTYENPFLPPTAGPAQR